MFLKTGYHTLKLITPYELEKSYQPIFKQLRVWEC